jgi:hypothetical protein
VIHLTEWVSMVLQTFRLQCVAILAFAIPAFATALARPGTLNFVEGQVLVDGRDISTQSVGSTTLNPGSVLSTQAGKAEVLLTPGVFLRLGSNSEVRMLSAGLMDTRIQVDRGVTLLEATDLQKENKIRISAAGLNTTLKDEGLYRVDADRSSVAVFDGKAEVRQGDEQVEVKKGKTVVASDAPLKAEKFDRNEAKKTDELYQWSSLRSKYLAGASAVMAQRVLVQPSLWYGSGWYWDPYMSTYSWLPGSSAYYSPFGYGFYSPWRYSAPIIVAPRYGTAPRYRVAPRSRAYPRGGIESPRMHPRSGGYRRGR